MFEKIVKKLFGDKSQKDLQELLPVVELINSEFQKLSSITDDQLRAKTADFKTRIKDFLADIVSKTIALKEKAHSSKTPIDEKEAIFKEIEALEKQEDEQLEKVLMELLPEAFAVVKETARRLCENGQLCVTANEMDIELANKYEHLTVSANKATWKNHWDAAGSEIVWNMIHYDVQLMGGTALHKGKIAEMMTGEGKTLVATLPVYLNALAGKGVHVITVNNYLAKRDAEWMGPIYQFHGLSVDCIDNHKPHSPERISAYNADITFGTNNEFGFDYLRDNMVSEPEGMVQRKHHYAIIDEVDSVLIDDARTPLIISGPVPRGDEHEFSLLKPKIEKLVNHQRKLVTSLLSEAKTKLAKADQEGVDKKELKTLLEEGGLSLLRSFRGLPKSKAIIKYLSEPGIKIQLQKTENFYLQDNAKEMPKADEVLYFVIDEKNNTIDLTEKGIDLISGQEDPEFYILPDIGTKIAEIESSSNSPDQQLKLKDELMSDYTVKAERIHSINQLLKAYALFEKDVEYVVMDNKVKIVDEQTGRIMDGRRYSDGLHQAIEAKENVKVEAASQTYATITLQNYFRMYHKLAGMTGTAETEAKEFWDIYELDVVVVKTNKPVIRKDQQDLVYKTAREKYTAIIDEIERLKNEGRPVLVGTTSVEVSELLSRMLKMKKLPHQVLNAKLHQKEAEVVTEAGKAGTVTIATNMAGRGTDIKLADSVKENGGLAIIGTERHDSRRVDRQLRGRSGRQGDPGASQFFVSLEDNLMRLFGSERIAKMMDRMGHKEGEVIQHSMISKSIERAQKKVEENNFGIRKRLLEFDDVMNSQRTAIYSRRKNALFGDKLELDLDNILYDVSESTVYTFQDSGDFDGVSFEIIRNFGIQCPFSEEEFLNSEPELLIEKLYHSAREGYNRKSKIIQDRVFPVIQNVYENQSDSFENIVIPFTDGRKGIKIVVNLKEAYESKGAKAINALERSITLGFIDNEWKEHLREMDFLKQSAQNAQYEQKDPLLIYKLEGYELFKGMLDKLNKDIISFLMKAQLPNENEQAAQTKSSQPSLKQDLSKLKTGREDLSQSTRQNAQMAQKNQGVPEKRQPVSVLKRPGRNERVKVLNIQSGETKQMKFKQAEPLINTGSWQLIED
ncbi:MAG: preprotein translocase subunit SecA [Crocinitomicaceae bacterium]|nr:preprotein translocase subunit SecA [Crocinitomicaceae bacterium]|tara:strand:+ start:3842 stop:7234 length:3393 start_codon:yes stop_codon:yes gene_type:complete